MPVIIITVFVVCAATVAFYFLRKRTPSIGQTFKSLSDLDGLEQRMAELEKAGITIREPYTLKDVTNDRPFALDGYWGLLFALAIAEYDEEVDADVVFCSQLYSFDTECIESNEGEYVNHILALSAITAGALQITHAKDSFTGWKEQGDPLHVTIDFICNGQAVHWEFDQHPDYFEPHVMEKLDGLLKATGSDMQYFALDPDGQNAIIGCLSKDNLGAVRRLTGLRTTKAAAGIRLAVDEGRGAEEEFIRILNK